MKKLIIFVMVTIFTFASTAAPSHSLNYGNVMDQLNDQQPYAKFLKSKKDLYSRNFSLQKFDDTTLKIQVEGQSITIEKLDDSRFKINGQTIKISKQDSAEVVFTKVKKAFMASSRQVSWIEALFFPEAQAGFWGVFLGVSALLVIGGWFGARIERNKWLRAANAAQAAPVIAVEQQTTLLPAFTNP